MCKAAAIRFGVVRFVECVQSRYICHSPPENFWVHMVQMRLILWPFFGQYSAFRRPDDKLLHDCMRIYFVWPLCHTALVFLLSDCILSSQATVFIDEASETIIVHLEDWNCWKEIWKLFGTVCNHLASFNISPVHSGSCVGVSWAIALSNNASQLSHPRVRCKVVWLKPDKRLLLQTDKSDKWLLPHLYC